MIVNEILVYFLTFDFDVSDVFDYNDDDGDIIYDAKIMSIMM